MLNYLTEILLGLIFIGLLYFATRISSHQDHVPDNQDKYLEIFEKQKKLNRDMVALKENLEQYHMKILKELHLLREERQRLEKLGAAKPVTVHNMFLNDRFEHIFNLQKQGLSVEEIAKKLDKGTGEVSFILDLAKQELKGDVKQ